MIDKLKKVYENIKPEIDQKHQTFKTIWELGDEEIKAELIFCTCTPQSNAHAGWKAVNALEQYGYTSYSVDSTYHDEMARIIGECGVRFKINKAKYIIDNLNNLYPMGIKYVVQNAITNNNTIETRNWLVKFIKGFGMKEASHFLRNIGQGDNLAILDRHIMRNLVELNVIDEIPRHLDKKAYLEIENKMIDFSKRVDIPMFALDFVFWYLAKGELFK